MAAIVILGLKIPFKALWEKVGVNEQPVCGCQASSPEYVYCPYCGIRKSTRKVKVYRSRLTGEETTYRTVNSIIEYLHKHHLDVYDANPRGYTDDPVYIYFTQPNCYLQVTGTNPMSMTGWQEYPYEIEEWLQEIVGEAAWEAGEFGLWAFIAASSAVTVAADSVNGGGGNDRSDRNETRTFIIPIGPYSD